MFEPLIEHLEPRRLFAATRIMPLGDSITEGLNGYNSYRYWLWNALRANNYDVDFVGSRHGIINGGSPGRTDFDQDHEGHSGWRAEEIAANAAAWMTAAQPDVVLLHIGTNDLWQGQDVASTVTDIGSIVDTLRSVNPNVTILLAQIIPTTMWFSNLIVQLNSQIPGLAAQKSTSQSPVIVVDQWTGYNAATETTDGAHPTEAGELKVANKWFGALQSVLRVSTAPPPVSMPLSSYNWTTVSNGFGPVESNHSVGGFGLGDGNTLTLNGVTYTSGLGMHANADVTYTFKRQFREFRALVGIDDEAGTSGSAVFRVYVDNVLKFDSGLMTATTPTKLVSVSLTDARAMRLVVTDGGDGNDWDHADWANATLFRQMSTGTPTTPPPVISLPPGIQPQRIRPSPRDDVPALLDEPPPIVD